MKQILQRIDNGATQVREVPAPLCGPREVLIANEASLVSAGTERAVLDLAKKSLLGKARERPDQVRRVLQKLAREGVLDTLRQVRDKLADPLTLGYSSAGVVLEVGREVARFRPGDRVACNGAHAGVVAVPRNLVARVPDGVAAEDACYATVGAIALQGVRLAGVGVGDRVAVIGLGLIGQIASGLLLASGCEVLATDLDESKCRRAVEIGAKARTRDEFVGEVEQVTDGQGVDAVVIAASTRSNDPLELAAAVARRRAKIVAVGAVGLEVPRRAFYPKELALIVSCSYGPGRYDAEYEARGNDYPYAYVRWTAQRNMEAVLELVARGRLDVRRLTTHRFAIEEGEKAFALVESSEEPSLGIVLTYPEVVDLIRERRVALPTTATRGAESPANTVGVGVLGAGNYATLVMLPALARLPRVRLRAICSAGGVSALTRGERHGFEVATTSVEEVLGDPAVDVVFVATRHHLHAGLGLAALRAGKAVFLEKPLAIDAEGLDALAQGAADLGERLPVWSVGFNRRFSPAARLVVDFFAGVPRPITIAYRFNAGPIPHDHWTQDPLAGGGRLIGEACHALDLAAFLMGGPIVRVMAESVAPGGTAGAGDDQAAILVRAANGSLASLAYFAGGNKGFPKERVEVFGGGKVAVIDDFRRVTLADSGRSRTHTVPRGDKGHGALLESFLAAVRTGGPPPIAYAELLNVSRAALAADESLRNGLPVPVA